MQHNSTLEMRTLSKVEALNLKLGQANVCSHTELTKTTKLQPVVKPHEKTKKVWKRDCPNGQRWCIDYVKQ